MPAVFLDICRRDALMAGRGVVRLSVDLIGDEMRLHKALKHRAIEEDRPVRELVIEALERYLESPATTNEPGGDND